MIWVYFGITAIGNIVLAWVGFSKYCDWADGFLGVNATQLVMLEDDRERMEDIRRQQYREMHYRLRWKIKRALERSLRNPASASIVQAANRLIDNPRLKIGVTARQGIILTSRFPFLTMGTVGGKITLFIEEHAPGFGMKKTVVELHNPPVELVCMARSLFWAGLIIDKKELYRV